MTTLSAQYEICSAQDFRVGIGNCNGPARNLKTGKVIQVIANKDYVLWLDSFLCENIAHDASFVRNANALNYVYTDFSSARCNNRARLRRKNHRLDSILAQCGYVHTVAARSRYN